jgi:hypothetical protein
VKPYHYYYYYILFYFIRFKSSSTFNQIPIEHIIEVRIGEFLNLVCPKYNLDGISSSSSSSSSSANEDYDNLIEYHSIYMVTKQEYEECKLNDIESKKPILKCDRPYENLKYTLYISKYSPVPDAIEFIPGNNYYFICKLLRNLYLYSLLIDDFKLF